MTALSQADPPLPGAEHAASPAAARPSLISAYARLTKARLSALVLLTTAVGFVQGSSLVGFAWSAFLGTLLGTAFTAGAANALNQVLEIRRDRLMIRTRTRPLPAGEMGPWHALVLSFFLTVTGVLVLAAFANVAAAALALVTLLIYVLLYTPLKARSTLNTLVGAICGATPPMIGWIGASGTADAGAWALGGILFIWQIPHFLALAWLYRDDYARGRFVMLPVLDRTGQLTCQIVILTSLMLMPMALTATLLGLGGWAYTFGSLAVGLWMLVLAVRLYANRTNANARRVFLASLVYLSAVLLLLIVDRGPIGAPGAGYRVVAGSVALQAD